MVPSKLLMAIIMNPSNVFKIFNVINSRYSNRHLCSKLGATIAADINSYAKCSHTCGELRKSHVGQQVKLRGWVQFRRLDKFLIIRDAHGITQLVVPDERVDIIKGMKDVTLESYVAAEGHVLERPAAQANSKLTTGEIEVVLDNFEILSKATPNLPFNVSDAPKVKESLRLQYRSLDLRHPKMQRNLRLRSDTIVKIMTYLTTQCNFIHIETPTLSKRTPGGAQEFLVPTRMPGKFYSLVQSPQLYKQQLVMGGFERYFQIARCYRDEGSKPDRQPEFTQLDIELRDTSTEEVQRLIEGLMGQIWPADMGTLTPPFPQMTYKEAMAKYGVDKPDTRFENLLQDVTELVRTTEMSRLFPISQSSHFGATAVVFSNAAKYLSKSVVEALTKSAKGAYTDISFVAIRLDENAKWKSSLAKKLTAETMAKLNDRLGASANDVLLMALGPKESTVPCMGKLRLEMANQLELLGERVRSDSYNFLWVVDFPLFLPAEDPSCEGLESAHHPFTAPHPDDLELLYTNPSAVRGLHYDLVLNGSEIGGGSIRINQSDVQEYVLAEILKEDASSFSYFLQLMSYGCPPHGGIALGLDRLLSIMCGAKHIRDVIAFPKSVNGKDLLTGGPSYVSDKDRQTYHLNGVPNAPTDVQSD